MRRLATALKSVAGLVLIVVLVVPFVFWVGGLTLAESIVTRCRRPRTQRPSRTP